MVYSKLKNIKIYHLFEKNKFWKKIKKKFGIPCMILGSVPSNRNCVMINLTAIMEYSKLTKLEFDKLYAMVIAHEIFHLEIIDDEVECTILQEEIIISNILNFEADHVSELEWIVASHHQHI